MLLLNEISGFVGAVAAGGGPVVITYRANSNADAPASPKTYAAMAIGTAGADRYVIAGIVGLLNGVTISGVTIGGVAAVQQTTRVDASGYKAEIWTALVPTGTTADVIVTFSGGTATNMDVVTCSMTGTSTGTATNTYGDTDDSNPLTASINIPANGGAFGITGNNSGTAVTWTNLTEDVDALDVGGRRVSSASRNDTVAQTGLAVSVTGTGTSILAIAAFGP